MASLDEIYAQKKAAPPPPETKDGPLDLHAELLLQYQKAKDMLQDAEISDEPLNYRVQALNAIGSVISQLVKLQSDLHTLEEIKRVEMALSHSLKQFPELQQEFFDTYKGALKL
jgi:hypothetical protein